MHSVFLNSSILWLFNSKKKLAICLKGYKSKGRSDTEAAKSFGLLPVEQQQQQQQWLSILVTYEAIYTK